MRPTGSRRSATATTSALAGGRGRLDAVAETAVQPLTCERFTFYGCAVEVRSSSAELVEEVRRDFACFRDAERGAAPARTQIQVEIRPMAPPYASLPALAASFVTPRNVCFTDGHLTYLDYFGQGLVVFDRRARRCVVYGTDHDLLHEIVYLYVLSSVGEYLDGRGLHRLHALGLSYRGRAVVLLLPSGGGKSTMALELLRRPGFRLLGEDTPLVDRHGRILPFPLRLGIRPGQEAGIPARYLRTVRRMEFDPKTLIDVEYFGDRVATSAVEPSCILVGQRNLGDLSTIVPLARRHAARALVTNMVVGLGVYQGVEFLLERGWGEVLGKSGVAASRLRNALALLARAPAYRFVLGRDGERNSQTLLQHLERPSG